MNYLNTKANRRQLAANRYRNARYVLFERCGGEIARFARTLQKSHSYVSAYVAEMPNKRMGEKVARMVEAAFSLGSGWLDVDRSASWDRRLKEAIGGAIHPLDEHAHDEEMIQDHERWLAGLSILPESGADLVRVGRQSQHHLQSIQQQIRMLTEQRRELLAKTSRMYEQRLETFLIEKGYVVQAPSYEQGPVFRVWHSDPAVKGCLQLRLQLVFEPVIQLIPIPPVTREVVVLPFLTEQSQEVEFLFLAADERSASFDVTRLARHEQALWLLGHDGVKQRDLTARLSLDPLFVHLN